MRKKKEILKIKLEKVYSPPTPERKGEFLQNLSYPQISFWEFLRIQAFYIGLGFGISARTENVPV